jgi:predicted HTH domain antitoxin
VAVINLDGDLVEALSQLNQPLEHSVRELIVVELYRRGLLSTGRSAELLGMPLLDFIQFSRQLGIPYGNQSADDWQVEERSLNETSQ